MERKQQTEAKLNLEKRRRKGDGNRFLYGRWELNRERKTQM